MFKLSYDLHIHSCLSPCAENDITPRSIVLLASLLGLNTVALTDHNSTRNLPAFFKAAEQTDIIPIAGMELNTAEEIHVLCLFAEMEAAMEFDEKFVRPALMQIKNVEEKTGVQLVVDENDNVVAKEEIWLNPATSIPLYSLAEPVNGLGGIIVPAHINRPSWGVISVLGDVPGDCGYNCVEVRGGADADELREKYPYLKQCRIIRDSDAHSLDNISLPVNFIEVEEKSAAAIIKKLTDGGQ